MGAHQFSRITLEMRWDECRVSHVAIVGLSLEFETGETLRSRITDTGVRVRVRVKFQKKESLGLNNLGV